MKTDHGILRLSALAITLGLSTAAAAAVRIVPDQYATIQAAVNASSSGDKIRVRPGVYYENVTVPAGKNNLFITAFDDLCADRGEVVVDAAPPPADVRGIGFNIDASGARLRCLTIRHATIGADVDNNGFTAELLRVIETSSNGIDVIGGSATVKDSEFVGTRAEALLLSGNAASVLRNSVKQSDGGCMFLTTNSATVADNVLALCEDDNGLDVEGNNNTIRNNTVDSTDVIGIDVFGNKNLIRNNQVSNAGGTCLDVEGTQNDVDGNSVSTCQGGIEVTGSGIVVRNNTANRAGTGEVFDIDCTGNCDIGKVTDNTATGGNDDSVGFDVFASSNGFTVMDNRATDNLADGFALDMDNGFIERNTALRNGTESDEHGFDIVGNGNFINNNIARENRFLGFQLEGSNNQFQNNQAERNLTDGIHVTSGTTNNVLDNNTAKNNLADGIENDGANTTVTRNLSTGNGRVDCANDGTIATNNNNTCGNSASFTTASSGLD